MQGFRSGQVRPVIPAAYVDLITNPEKYYGETILTHATLSHLDGSGYYLVLRATDWGYFDLPSSVKCEFELRPELEKTAEELLRDLANGILVQIAGRFAAINPEETFPALNGLSIDVIELIDIKQMRIEIEDELKVQENQLEQSSGGNR